jgi:hypothetical protein
MELEDMRHKIIPMHRDALRRMLSVNEVPEPVLVRYFTLKQHLDKVSASISTMDLLRMAEDVGFNLETGKFVVCEFKGMKILADTELDQAAATGGTAISLVNSEIDRVEKAREELDMGMVPLTEIEEKANADARMEEEPNPAAPITEVDPTPKTGNEVLQELVDADPTEATEKDPILENGTQVSLYIDGEPATGIIKNHSVNGTTKEVIYKVDVDGEEVDVSEDDIE